MELTKLTDPISLDTRFMQLVSEFLEKFNTCLLQQDYEQLMALSMPDDIAGWGLYGLDDYNSTDDLLSQTKLRKSRIKSGTFECELLDVFGNGDAVAVICNCRRNLLLKDGQIINDSDLRLSFYLVEHENQLKIRHSHISRVWPMNSPFPSQPVPDRANISPLTNLNRLSEAENGPFIELLNKRTAYTEAANLEGMLGLQHQNNSNVYWQLQGGTLRGNDQYRKHLLFLKERFHEPLLKYQQPVVFKNKSLACLSAYAYATYQSDNARHTISPLRVTYILQETEGQWLCRHSHWSIPLLKTYDNH